MTKPPFLALRSVDDALSRLLDADHLTLVVGAGASVEGGFPTWPTLIRRLLERLGSERGLSGDELDAFCSWSMETDGLTGAAAVVESNLGEDVFRRWVREELYMDAPAKLVPGPSARACARLKALRADQCEVVTTNYDPLLRHALREEPGLVDWKVDARVDDSPATSTEAVVRHLHGYITRSKTFGDVVLAEGHYHAMQGSERAWQESFMRRRLQHGPCLFVGTSLTDPNLLRYLYRTSGAARHVALFTRQQEAAQRRVASGALEETRDASVQLRWDRLGIHSLLADYYTDSAQFLWELVWRIEQGSDGPTYLERLSRWETIIGRELGPEKAVPRFASKQDELQEHLAAELERLLESLADDGFEPHADEKLGMHLWVYLPSSAALLMIGGSDRAWRDPSTLAPLPINWESNSHWASVQAFCSGSLASQSTAHESATRWNHVVGVPLFSSSPPWGRLPLGALTMASTLPGDNSVLGRGLGALRAISGLLVERAATLLIPPDEGSA